MKENHPDPQALEHLHQLHAAIGSSVKQLRQSHGWTLEEAAAIAGITTKKLAAIERGTFYHNTATLSRLLERLGGRLAVIPATNPAAPLCTFLQPTS